MRFDRVRAIAFGPFRDRSLELTAGMNVIYGPNESGKSSWANALSAGFAGIRRGAGRRKAEREFEQQHRPWDGGSWKAGVEVTLADGRQVTIHQDLADKVDSGATDERGRDISNEIIYDGAPDGSRWLGLNRDTFGATAIIRQSEVLGVIDNAEMLQTALQSAAATARSGGTAAQALATIDTYMKEHVGQDRANSTRPLRSARDLVRASEQELDDARAANDELKQVAAQAQEARREALAAARLRDQGEAAVANELARRLELDHAKALEYDGRFPDGAPLELVADDQLAQRVVAALSEWSNRPTPQELQGPTEEELRQAINSLPEMPVGDLEVAEKVVSAAAEHNRAVAAFDAVTGGQGGAAVFRLRGAIADLPDPPDGDLEPSPEVEGLFAALIAAEAQLTAARDAEPALPPGNEDQLDPSELRRLADRLEAPISEVNPQLGAERDQALAELGEAATTPRPTPWIVGGFVAIAGGVGMMFVFAPLAAVLSIVGIGLLGFATWRRSAHRSRKLDLMATVQTLDARLGPDAQRAGEARAARTRAEERIRALGLRANPAQLRVKADELSDAANAQQRHNAWSDRINRLETDVTSAQSQFLESVRERDEDLVPGGLDGDARAIWDRYRTRCRGRFEEAQAASRVDDLTDELERAESEERRVAHARKRLVDALLAQGVPVADDSQPGVALAEYEQACRDRASQAESARDRDALGANLDARLKADEAFGEASEQVRAAVEGLAAVAEECGVNPDGDSQETVTQLEAWCSDREGQMENLQDRRSEWIKFETLLNGRTVEELGVSAVDARRRAEEMVGGLSSGLEPTAAGVTESELRDLRTTSQLLQQEAASLEGVVKERSSGVASVPEAEEAVAAAETELARVLGLQETLTTTRMFLEEAEERVHRTIAPLLRESVESSIELVTEGRYREVRVDPDTLSVKVSDDGMRWRDATRLSTGTSEQIYLLLRAAMVEHLARKDEPCPLLLDDPTVNSDNARTVALLEALRVMSIDRQIILFSQEDEVAAWARDHLSGPADSFQELKQLPVT